MHALRFARVGWELTWPLLLQYLFHALVELPQLGASYAASERGMCRAMYRPIPALSARRTRCSIPRRT
eukprot:2111837-Rhodomonas_salina.1